MAFFLIRLLAGAANAWSWLIVARAIASFAPPGNYSPFWRGVFRFLWEATEPILRPIRRLLPTMGPLDFSPLVALILLQIVVYALDTLLFA